MKAWVLRDKRKMYLEDRPMPQLKDDEVLIRIKAMGICGSDMHFYTDLKIGDYATNGNPLIVGHECSGEIVSVGKDCRTLKVGDRVAVEPGKPCMKCDECREGRYNFCHDMYFMGTYPWDGCMCEYVAWPEFLTYKMPDSMTYEVGSVVEPFVVGLQAMKNSGIHFGDTAVVLGCGAIGLMTIQALKSIGAGRIIAVGRTPFKLDLARKMGATDVINSRECADVVSVIKSMTGGYGAQYAYECVGSDRTFAEILNYVRDGGTVTYLGLVVNDGTPMPMASVVMRGLTFKTVIRYTNLFDKAIRMIDNGTSDITPVITQHFQFSDGDKAFERALDKSDAIKIVIDF